MKTKATNDATYTRKIGQTIKALRKQKHISQVKLANAIGVSEGVIKCWEGDVRYPSRTNQKKLCDYFEIDIDYLLGLTPIRNGYSTNNIVQIPLYDCSDPKNLFDDKHIIEMLVLPKFFLKKDGIYFAICVQDNSMINAGLNKGDIAIIERTVSIRNNEIGLFMIDDKIHCRVNVIDKKRKAFMSMNTDYPSFLSPKKHSLYGKLAATISSEQ